MNVLISQNQMIEEHTHKINVSLPYGPYSGGSVIDSYSGDWHWENDTSRLKIQEYGSIETRPFNFTITAWKRIN